MAKSEDGFFGKLSGKIGDVVIASWKGIPYIRSKPSGNPSNTRAQQTQRTKFGVAVKFVDSIGPVIKAGFKWNIDRMTERNAAISYMMKNAVQGEKPDIRIDYSLVLVARGDLPTPKEASVKRSAPNTLVFRWLDNSGPDNRRAGDKVLALAYCPALKEGVWITGGTVRVDEMAPLTLPDAMSDKQVETYLAFADPAADNASDSIYLGAV